jgi:DNA-binding protein H-NS
MARPKNLMTLSVEALLKMRDDVAAALTEKAGQMRRQLGLLTGTESKPKRGRPPGKAKAKAHPLKGRKAAAKYRGPNAETWAGRGQQPRWLREALAGGAKVEDFAIGSGTPKSKATSTKRGRPRKKAA